MIYCITFLITINFLYLPEMLLCFNNNQLIKNYKRIILYSNKIYCNKINDNNNIIIDSNLNNSNNIISTSITSTTQWNIQPIGLIESPYSMGKHNVPKQATISRLGQVQGYIRVFPEYKECLLGLSEFDYIWAITWMHLNEGYKKKIRPQPRKELIDDDDKKKKKVPNEVGLFASRSPHRPNQIALSALKIVKVDMNEGLIHIEGLDLLDGTPILDIKPYIPAFDSFNDAKAGWMDLLLDDMYEARKNGYQQIHSPRGARAARAREREREKNLNEKNNEENNNNDNNNNEKTLSVNTSQDI